MKTGETIIVLIIFFILLAMGMVFYAKIQTYTSAQKKQEMQSLDAIALEQRIRHLSEIACSTDGTVNYDCYDLQKIKALQKVVLEYPLYYSSAVFQNSKITITSVYPVTAEIALYDSGSSETSTGSQPYRTPVSLYDPVTDTHSFGYITIEVSS